MKEFVKRPQGAGFPFVHILHVLLAGWLLSVPASAADKTVGVILPGDIQYYRDIQNSFTAKLNREGYSDKVEIVVQKPYPDSISLSNAARKLIAIDVDVIVVHGAPAALAVVREKTRIPVVYSGVYDPLAPKIRARNVTGISARVSVSSLLRYLRGMSSISTLGVVYSAGEEDSAYQMRELLRLSQQYGLKMEGIDLRRPGDAKTALSGRKYEALFVTGGYVASMALPSIMEFARERKIPTASLLPDRNSHAIVTLSASPKEQGERIADMVIRLLGGADPERVRAESSNDTDLVFNLKEAMSMGFRIPMDLVTEATRLIQ